MSTPSVQSGRPLILTADPLLLDDLLRLVATAGSAADVAPDPGAVRAGWDAAPLVLVGADRAEEVARLGMPRRAGVVLVSSDLDDAGVWERAVRIGAELVAFVPDGEAGLAERIAEALGGPHRARIVSFIGGRGGAGASTLAATLALVAARKGLETTLIDADPLGGGVDMLLGGEHAEGFRWPDLAELQGPLAAGVLRRALPRFGGLNVLSWDRSNVLRVPPEAMRSALEAGRRGSDLVVVDLPRQHPDLSTEPALGAGPVLLVVPAEVRAVAAAGRVAAVLAEHSADLRVVVRGPAPAGLTAEQVVAELGLPLAGYLRPEKGLEAALDVGVPPGLRPRSPLATLCRRMLTDLAPRLAA